MLVGVNQPHPALGHARSVCDPDFEPSLNTKPVPFVRLVTPCSLHSRFYCEPLLILRHSSIQYEAALTFRPRNLRSPPLPSHPFRLGANRREQDRICAAPRGGFNPHPSLPADHHTQLVVLHERRVTIATRFRPSQDQGHTLSGSCYTSSRSLHDSAELD